MAEHGVEALVYEQERHAANAIGQASQLVDAVRI